jgi:hypothetical protein
MKKKMSWAMVVFFTFAILAACTLNRSPILSFPGSASPNVVCPGDEVTVNWDLSRTNADCARDPGACERDPLTIDITATGGMTFTINNAPVIGSRTVRITGPEDATIRLHAYDTNQDLGTPSVVVNVLGAGEELSFPASCPGACLGSIIGWNPMEVRTGTSILSPSVRIKRIQNISGAGIRLTVNLASGTSTTYELTNGASTPDITERINTVTAAPQPASLASFGGDCSGGGSTTAGTAPRPINLTVFYGCP